MKRFRTHIALGMLASLYLVTWFGLLVSQITMPPVSSGLVSVSSATGSSKEQDDRSWWHRRHIPLVYEVPEPLLTSAKLHLDQDLRKFHFPRFDEKFLFGDALYFSSLSDKSPPLS